MSRWVSRFLAAIGADRHKPEADVRGRSKMTKQELGEAIARKQD